MWPGACGRAAAAEDAEYRDGAAGRRGRGCLGQGGGEAAGSSELPLTGRNGFFASTVSAISAISAAYGRGTAALSVCLAPSLPRVGYNRSDRRREMVAVECVCSAIGGDGCSPGSARLWCLQSAFDKQGTGMVMLCGKWKSSGDINASERRLAQISRDVHAPPLPTSGLQDLGVIDYLTIKLFSHLKRCMCTESVQCF